MSRALPGSLVRLMMRRRWGFSIRASLRRRSLFVLGERVEDGRAPVLTTHALAGHCFSIAVSPSVRIGPTLDMK